MMLLAGVLYDHADIALRALWRGLIEFTQAFVRSSEVGVGMVPEGVKAMA